MVGEACPGEGRGPAILVFAASTKRGRGRAFCPLTTEFYTRQIRRLVFATSGNRLLRDAGRRPDRTLTGPAFHAKMAVFAAGEKNSGMRRSRCTKPVSFCLDEGVPDDC
jgi:hypothetical protein